MICEIKVNNVPKCAEEYKYIVARKADEVEGLWFYGAWNADHYDQAVRAAQDIDGILLENPNRQED